MILGLIQSGSSHSQTVVYPLHPGDTWDYDAHDPFHIDYGRYVVGDTLMPNGKMYTVINEGGYEELQRQAGNQVFHYRSDLQAERLLFDFSSNVGDTSDAYLGIVQDDTVFGKSLKTYFFYYPSKYNTYLITDSIGITWINGTDYTYELVRANINGVQYSRQTGIRNENYVPLSIGLLQNYPNPFNPSTTIKYDLSEKSLVSLKVFDILGREIMKLVENERQEAGEHTVTLDASGLSSGSYYYRLITVTNGKSVTHTNRMILLK
jgi:hypothetical protein